ncbi:MAG: PEP-CTERM sorting domain-containing protein [Bryobacteraceae bacterium]|nr:PEP-CTERM sorting domain-containing protein [Bryobacteraceae bacterium]
MQLERLFIYIVAATAVSLDFASAASVTFLDRVSFQTALNSGRLSGQTFDSVASGTILNTLDGVTYAASAGLPEVTDAYLTTTPLNGLGSTSQALIYFGATETASFTFATPITAFAIDVNTFAPAEGDYTATLDTGNIVSSRFDVFPGLATGQFIGFVSDTAFRSVTINAIPDPEAGEPYSYTLDTLVYGNASDLAPVPEPSTLIMLGGGLAFLGFKLRKRP